MLDQGKTELEKYFIIKKDIELPVKVRLYFLIFQNVLDQTKTLRTIQSRTGFSKQLVNAFTNLSLVEKGHYLLNNINFVAEQLDHQRQKTKEDSKIQTDGIMHVETTCDMLLTALKINYWTTVSLKLDKLKKILSITNKKKCFLIDMRNYFVRRSKKYKNSVVLQAITEQINNQARKYIFSFTIHIIAKVYEQLLKCCLNCQQDKILSLMGQEQIEQKQSKNNETQHQALVFLNSKNINDYLAYKQKVEKQIMVSKFQFKAIFKDVNIKIQQSTKIDKVFRMEANFQISPRELKEKFIYSFNNQNKYVVESQLLESFSKKYKAVYEKLQVKSRFYEYISIREESLSHQEQILFVKGVQNIMGRNYIQFIQARIRNQSQTTSKLIIHMAIGLSAFITKQVVKMFLLEMYQMVSRKIQIMESRQTQPNQPINQQQQDGNEEDEDDDDDFKTVKGSQEYVGYLDDDCEMEGTDRNGNEVLVEKKIQDGGNGCLHAYLKAKHHDQIFEQQKYHKRITQHYLFKQWLRIKGGGVICTNTQTINKQKNLFKEGLAKFGRNILKGDILKLSMPIAIFKKESHLHTIAKNLSYAPMLFDRFYKKNDPLEQVKYTSLLIVSVGTLGISMEKPFNPILGETLQCRLDGCPIYLQQISHHPPISSYYFLGRGYKIYGEIQAKVSFGLNNVKGYSIRPNYIIFDDGTQIQMIYGKVIIKGMLFGDREFNFEDKIYVYDKTNHIFSEVIYGPKKKNPQKKPYPLDYFYGSITRVKPEFLQLFNNSNPRIYPTKQHIIQELSTFEGIWNQQVKFDNKLYINFTTQLPFQLIPEDNPLLSNSTYRVDLIRLIEDNMEESQIEKDRMEDLQRRDKKLREKHR